MMENEFFKGTVFFSADPLPLLLMSLAVGGLSGFLRDLLDLFCRLVGKNRAAVFFADLFSVLFCYSALFVCALNEENGILRWYHAVLAIIGFRLYRTLFSPSVQKILSFLLSLIRHAVQALLFPLRLLAGYAAKLSDKRRASAHLRREKREYEKSKKSWLRLASRGFDCLPPRTGEAFS